LCFAWGIEDVEAWFDDVAPRVLDFWQAFDAVEPIGEQRLQSARIETMLSRVVEYIAATHGHEMEPTTINDCMPYRYKREQSPKATSKPSDPKTEFAQIAASLGFGKVLAQHGRINKPS
jgi:hypothetical protein